MAEFRAMVLEPGRRFVGWNPDGSKRFADFTPAYCRAQFERNQAMIAAKIPVPVSWEHRDDQRPGRLSLDDWNSERAKGTAGHVLRYEIDDRHKVWNVFQVPDESDAKRAEVVRFCSPEIDDFTDGDGKHWGEVFTHIALTPRPRQHHQPPIQRLSLLSNGPIRLAIDPTEGTDMPDAAKPPETPPKPPEAERPKPPEEKKPEGALGTLIEALRAKGIVIPGEVTDLAGLTIAVKASGDAPLAEAVDDDEDDEERDELDDEDEVVPAGHQPISLSLQKQRAEAEGLARKTLAQRITGLVKTGRVTPQIAEKLRADAGKVRLSFSATGDLKKNDVTVEVAAYERLPKNAAFSKKGRRERLSLEADPVGQPEWVTKEDQPADTPEARKKRQDAWDATTKAQ